MLLEYLKSPMKTGVHVQKSLINFSNVSKYLRWLLPKQDTTVWITHAPMMYQGRLVPRLKEVLRKYDRRNDSDIDYFDVLTKALFLFGAFSECPASLKRLYTVRGVLKGRVLKGVWPYERDIFSSRAIPPIGDVIHVDRRAVDEDEWFFTVTSIAREGLIVFNHDLESIPPLNGQITILKEIKSFSSRHVFKPYALSAKTWLGHKMSLVIPSDLKQLLSRAIDYLSSEEWRTSTLMSAIAVESILADLHEESHRGYAPDVPLGELFKQVKNGMPEDVQKAVGLVNEARIAAVHRSSRPVGEREAVHALHGAVRLTLWHASEFRQVV